MKFINLVDEVSVLKKEIREWIVAIAVAVVLVVVLVNFVAKPYNVKGDSMYPTLKDKEKVIVNIIGKKLGGIDKGNVIVFHANEKADYVKRVIGTAGDKVEYKKDQLYINGKKVDEPYLKYNLEHKNYDQITEDFSVKTLVNTNGEDTIPKGKLLVLGDNREVSKDSRSFGLIDEDQVVGKVSFRFWPLNEFKFGFNPEKSEK